MLQALRFGSRRLVRSPCAAAGMVLTLSVAAGVVCATYSLCYAILVCPLNFPSADQLIRVWNGADPSGRKIGVGAVSIGVTLVLACYRPLARIPGRSLGRFAACVNLLAQGFHD
jgi:hypothetical protein